MEDAMKMNRFVLVIVYVLAAAVAAGATTTLQNLQTAFNGESNANARYLVFAQKADQEGYLQAAALFRAAAKAEQIHAANHAVVIKKMGATPQAKIETAEVKSTLDNLQAAIKGETYEKDVMYPEFLKQARAEGNRDAIETFNFAKGAEIEHAKLYTAASKDLPGMKAANVKYYVCTVCGYTTKKIDFEKCPACFNPKEKYVAVS
jgi:rubrerythrin